MQLIGIQSIMAQDGHYWTQQYGTRSILLSNSVIGGVNDLGAVYYNPGRLSLVENPAFLLNVNVYELTQLKFDDAVGEGADRSKTSFGSVPTFVAGTFKLKQLEGHQFAYSIIQRQNLNFEFNFRDEVLGDVIENFPGEEYFGANINFSTRLKEDWYSLSWSYPLKENLSIGITGSATRYSIDKGTLIELQALTASNEVAQLQLDRNYSINNYGLLWKLGVAGIAKRFQWGVTVTTPSISFTGKGKYNYEQFFSGIKGVSTNPDQFVTSRQSDLSIKYKRPLAAGGGISIPLKKSELHFSMEWYSAIKEYTIMEAVPYIAQSSGDTITFTLVDDLESVTNFGIGAEIYFGERLSGFASVSTDFSAVPEDITGLSEIEPVANNSVFSTNLYHFAGGVVWSLNRADITLGFASTGGKQDFTRPVDFPDEDDDGIFDQDETGSFQWRRMRVIFSFSFPFLKDAANRFGGDNGEN
jgi:hypothetical protein